MNDRDMMYGGFYQNTPCNMQYGNFGFQGMPGSLMYGNTITPNMVNTNSFYDMSMQNGMNNGFSSDVMNQIASRLTSLENRVKLLEQRLGNTNSYQDDNSMYMI